MRVPSDRRTQDQCLAVMLFHGTEDQQREAVRCLFGDVQIPLFGRQ